MLLSQKDIEEMMKVNHNKLAGWIGFGAMLFFLHRPAAAQLLEEWVARYSGPGAGNDVGRAIAGDAQGNMYVTGSSEGNVNGFDIATAKYNAAGALLWSVRYDGPQHQADHAVDLEVDGQGNVYVTGSSQNGAYDEIATIKYNSVGEQIWVQRDDGVANGEDVPIGLAVDGSGNVYVVGRIYSPPSQYSFCTQKYDSLGERQWWLSYEGGIQEDDFPLAMTLDHEGNVLVVGYSDALDGVGVNYDFVTLKYDPMGALIFSDRTGTSGSRDDRAAAVAAHTDGSFYVAGYSSQGTESRIRVIKYDTAGSVDWDMEYAPINYSASYASHIGLDEAGNAFVGGKSYSSDTNWDYTLIKLNPDGDQQWTAHYNGLANGYDESAGLAVTGGGTAYLTGWSMGQFTSSDCATLSYSSDGDLNWAMIYNGPSSSDDGSAGIALAPNDRICVVGNAYNGFALQDYLVLNYSSAGIEQWAAFYNGPSDLWDLATDLCLSQEGGIYVAGAVSHTYLGRDFLLIKYDANGMALWTATYNHSANEDDRAEQVAVDVEGNVYVTGASEGTTTQDDYATVKYNSLGEQLWVARYNGPDNEDDRAEDVGVNSLNEVWVTGRSTNASNSYDIVTVKYDANGTQLWTETYGSVAEDDWSEELAFDSQENVLVAGVTAASGTNDFLMLKYAPTGQLLWAATYNGPAQGSDELTALAIDPSDNVYAAGESEGSGTYGDFLVVKYNPSGDLMWTARYDGADHLFDAAADLGIDSQGNVIVTGSTETASGRPSIMTIKYNSQGVLLWAQVYDSTAGREDYANALAIANDDRIYVTGSSFLDPATGYLTIVYSPSGELLGSAIYNGPANGHDEPVALVASPNGDVYVTGRSFDLATDDDLLTIKYSMVTGIGDEGSGASSAPVAFRLNAAYPNPFNASATIRFELPISGMTRLEVFDLAGRMVGRLVDGWKPAGSHQVAFDGANLASGLYICRMQAGDFESSAKMVLMK
jgi:uncharacterized delta-60 repeat protein